MGPGFEREARILARLRHSALPVVSDYFSEPSGQFLVMQYIPGDDLDGLLKRQGHPFPVAQVLEWADQLLDALEYLHSQFGFIIPSQLELGLIENKPDRSPFYQSELYFSASNMRLTT